MKIKCVWVYKDGDNDGYWNGKEYDVTEFTSGEIINTIANLLAREETIRVIFEKGEIQR